MALQYRIEGTGAADADPLVLLHGLGVTYTIWQNLVPLLSPYYKLILVELPGHGATPALPPNVNYYQGSAALLEELRCELGIEKWNILAYSMGAWAGQVYLQQHASRVGRSIFLCPARLNRFWAYSMRGVDRADRLAPVVSAWLLSGWRLCWLVRWLGFAGKEHPYGALWTQEIQTQPVPVIVHLLRDLPGYGLAPFPLPPVPVLFIWGDQDAIVAHPSLKQARDNDVFVPGYHSSPMLAAQPIARAILDFLARE
jgi:pimeloyl-ACP methyl ester carboxylesterase